MKQKFLLFLAQRARLTAFFIIAAFMATTSAWAQCPQYFYDTIPAQRYITNFKVIWENNEGDDYELPYLKFEDTFRPDLQIDRKYAISIEARHANDLNTGCKFRYITQADEPSATLHWNRYEYWSSNNDIQLGLGANIENRLGSFGGTVIHQKLSMMIGHAIEKGVKEVIFFVNPQYKDVNAVTEETKYVSFYGAADNSDVHNINYFTYTLPEIVKNTLSAPKEVKSGSQLQIMGSIQAFNNVSYKLQERSTGEWRTIKSGFLSTKDARAGKKINYNEEVGNGHTAASEYRMVVTNETTGQTSISNIAQVQFLYKRTYNGNVTDYSAGETFYTYVAADCMEYKVTSDLPITKKTTGGMIEWTMPACDVTILYQQPTYTVKFLNADYTLLKTVEVECGEDATSEAPANPTYSTHTFTGWSQDLTNIHKNMSVVAKYDIGNTYWFDAYLSDHENSVFPVTGFDKSETRAMVGDKLTFTADVFAATNATIAYETAFWDNNAQDYLWQTNGHIQVANYTTPNKEQFFNQTIQVAYTPNNSYINPFQRKMAVRFIMFIAGQTIYSDPWEIDIYYPLTINAPETDALFVENTAGDFNMGEQNIFIPARYNDTIRLYSINGADGGCLSYGRVLYPSRSLESGIDENGNAYIIAPGEQETINTSVSEKLVVFDGVYGNGYPKQLDFTAQGFGKMNGYYAEVVPCGGSVTMPEDPTENNAIFLGWEAWNTDYADDAYLHVPAVGDNIIGFTAKFEYLPEVPTYTVRFYGKDGLTLLSTQTINEGENATPPEAPEVSGYHFVGWDKPYTTITANTDITALYGEDTKTWTVTYRDVNEGSNSYIKIGEEVVNDGEAAAQSVALISKEGYTFAYWGLTNSSWKAREEEHADLSHVTSNMAVFARWKKSEYTITYTMDGVEIFSEQVEHGDMPTAYQAIEDQGKPSTEQYVYTFDHWNPTIVAATADASYEAVFTQALRKYLVRFQNWDHTVLDEQQVAYGTAATAPADPVRDGYTFTGWDREFNNILADMTVTALFEKNKPQTTGIDEIVAEEMANGNLSNRKLLIDGTLYILRPDGAIYNATGMRVK